MMRCSRLKTGFAIAAALAVSACAEEPTGGASYAAAASRPVPVIVEPLRFEHARTRVEAVGTSRAMLSAELYSATSGEVVAVHFEPGQAVEAGDVLVELDQREQLLALQAARLQLEDAERLYDRYQRSADSGAVLPTTLDAARTAVATARIELERARIALDDRTIEAVFDGHVGATEVDPGDRVGPDTLITTLDDRSGLLVSFDIPEAFIGELEAGDFVHLETWSASMPAVTGEIVDIGSRVDPQNRTFVARARVDNADDQLRPGMSFKVNVNVQGERYAVISETGVQWGTGGAYVWSIVDGAASRIPVQVIQRREGRVLVDGDFGGGDIIVVEGTQRMRDGVTVSYDAEKLAEARKTRFPGGAGGVAGYSTLD
jgi:RND family efflux transporter MFP subunit